MRGVSIEIIDAVQRFENTNVFSMDKNLDRMIEEQFSSQQKSKRPKFNSRKKVEKTNECEVAYML